MKARCRVATGRPHPPGLPVWPAACVRVETMAGYFTRLLQNIRVKRLAKSADWSETTTHVIHMPTNISCILHTWLGLTRCGSISMGRRWGARCAGARELHVAFVAVAGSAAVVAAAAPTALTMCSDVWMLCCAACGLEAVQTKSDSRSYHFQLK